MNMSLAEKLKKQAANQLYSNRIQNFTQKELILKSYSKSAQFLEMAIECLNNGDTINFRNNTNNAIILIQTMLSNLVYIDSTGNVLEVALNLNSSYNYILDTLRKGLRNNSTKDFDSCIKFINELYFAFNSIK